MKGNKMEKKQKIEIDEIEKNLLEEEETLPLEIEEQEVKEEEKPKKPLSKNAQAKEMMQQAESLIRAADDEVKEVHAVVDEHVSLFEQEKNSLTETISTLSTLLDKVNYTYNRDEESEPFELKVGVDKGNLRVSDVGAGRFSGLILGAIGTVATAGAWVYFASQKTGVALDEKMLDPKLLENIPSNPTLEPMFTWIGGGMTGGAGNALFGMATLVGSSLLVGYALYKMRVAMKENKNFKVAKRTLDKSERYLEQQKEAKSEIEKIGLHVEAMRPVMENYRVVIEEQKAKLQRVLHIEGALEESSAYDSSSQQIMRESETLMRRIEQLITVPVSKEGSLNEASTYALMEAKAAYDGFIAKLYS